LTNRLCGKSRPHHFDGVCTVVLKLFNLIQPQVAIFGEKDAQQLAILKAMVKDLHLAIEIQAHPVVRNEKGLALSSRNQYLDTPEMEQTALALFETLVGIATAVHTLAPQAIPLQKAFELSWQSLQPMYPLGESLEWEYIEAVDAETFAPQETLTTTSRLLVAARLKGVRLIDTLRIDSVLP
jgi:pantoate--beta-alanine ligase